ncbi:CHASE2 domain-containing protein [Spirochaeta dissipatitropha]
MIPLALSLLILTPRFRNIDYMFYDTLLGMRRPVQEAPEILLLNVDDDSIARVGTWPWSRSVLADGLIHLGEFGARMAIFDIEYVDPSPMGVAPTVLNEDYPRTLFGAFGEINQNISDLFRALERGMIPLEEAETFIAQLVTRNEDHREQLLDAARAIARDNDLYHGRAALLYGSAYYTNTMIDSESSLSSDEAIAFARENFNVPRLSVETEKINFAENIQPVILPIGSRSAGAGFPDVPIDTDGVRRRIRLIQTDNQGYFGQLALRPLLDFLGQPNVYFRDREVLLEDAVFPDGSSRDIRIPRTDDGTMLITWPPDRFDNTFRQLSYSRIFELDEFEAELVKGLEDFAQAGMLRYHPGGRDLLPWYYDLQDIRYEMFEYEDRELYKIYIEQRSLWYDAVIDFLHDDTLAEFHADVDRILAREDLAEHLRTEYSEIRQENSDLFDTIQHIAYDLAERRSRLFDELDGVIAIIGWTGVSTTDIGQNPFDERYMNVGTHAAVANTILQQDFLIELPYWISIILGFVLTMITGLLVRNSSARRTMITGLIVLLATVFFIWLLFTVWGAFLRPAVPVFSITLALIGISLLKFYFTESEKRYISGAFSRYLSEDVIAEILNDPSKLNLGGEKRELTAIFTDVKGFSTISEVLDPQDLVKLLNRYLSTMSDLVLELGGTIDKYEGDAIIAFYGAPLLIPDNAYRACLAGVRMKRAEAELNRVFAEEGSAPSPLLTRIGINSGDMVVGNMGTERKMDYTIMGHHVNLAARLEGVNKQYGSWILASENTVNKAKSDMPAENPLLFRLLDRVRVVGVREPVRLYEVLEEQNQCDDKFQNMLKVFTEGLQLFEAADFTKAKDAFNEAIQLRPEDGPSQVYLARCIKYMETPPPENWDGVFSLTQK